jgi:hypothetical protein
MMKKRIQKIFLALCLLTVAFSGCGTKTKVEEKTVDDGVSKAEIANLGTDDSSQNYWFTNVHNFAKGNGGYYYMSNDSTYLCFFDESLGESYYVCNKSNCQHDDEDCNAYLRASSKKNNNDESKVGYTISSLYFYNGYLYLLDYDGYLVRFSADGSERKRICILDNYPHDGSTGTNLVFYKDSVYVYSMNQHLALNEEYTETIIRYSLDGKSSDTVVSYKGVNSAISNVRVSGNQLFFIVQSYELNTDTRELNIVYKDLYVYNMDSGDMGVAIEGSIMDYSLNQSENKIYYYVKSDGLYVYDISSKEAKRVYEATDDDQYAYISSDSNYIYINNYLWTSLARRAGVTVDATLKVLDKTGREVSVIDSSDIYNVFWGDENYLFAEGVTSDVGASGMRYIKKSEISTSTEWRDLP